MSQPFVPRPWQPPMIEHIRAHPRCAVYAAPGAGKTGATLIALLPDFLLDNGPVLVLAPRRVAQRVWPNEVSKWDELKHLKVSVVKGTPNERKARLKRSADIYTINYEQLPWLIEHLGDDWPFKIIVADESTRLKGFRLRQGGKRTRALAKVAWRPDVTHFIELTGTPSPNGLKDLWGQIWFVDKGDRLGKTFDAFSTRWFRPSWDGYSIEPFPHSQGQIQEKLVDICTTINPGDYIAIDEPIEHVIEVDLPTGARELYDEMEREMFVQLGNVEIEAVNAAGRTLKCLQLANGAVYHGDRGAWADVHDAKLDAVESIMNETGGMPILLGYQFKSDLARLRKRFPFLKTLDDISVEDFATGHHPLLAGHPASMGHGVDGLQDGTHILVDFSSGWDLELDQQIVERIGPVRQFQSGYKRPVYRYRIVAVDTVDEMVAARRRLKCSVQDILLAAMNRGVSLLE